MILTAENSVKVCCCRVRKRKVDFFGSLAWLLSAINIGLLVVVILVPMWTIAEAQIAGVSYKWETGVFYHCTQIKGTNLQYPLAYDWTRCEANYWPWYIDGTSMKKQQRDRVNVSAVFSVLALLCALSGFLLGVHVVRKVMRGKFKSKKRRSAYYTSALFSGLQFLCGVISVGTWLGTEFHWRSLAGASETYHVCFYLAIANFLVALTLCVALIMKARNLFQYLAKLRQAIATAGDAPAVEEKKPLKGKK